MENLLRIFINSIFIDNMVFAVFLGMCSYLAVSKTVKTAFGLGLAVIFVLGITMPINWLINNWLLDGAIMDLDLTFLRLILFIAVIVFICTKGISLNVFTAHNINKLLKVLHFHRLKVHIVLCC